MQTTKVVITIPMLPPKELSPNFRGHWGQRYRATSEFKGFAKVSIPLQVRGRPPHLDKAEISITFVIPNQRHYRDPDNAFACLKPAIDACVDAGILVDDGPERLFLKPPIVWKVDREKAPMTILEFTEKE